MLNSELKREESKYEEVKKVPVFLTLTKKPELPMTK
jgi:hypothetical protein